MFMDDLLGLVFHAGNVNSTIGYIGDEHPLYMDKSVTFSFAEEEEDDLATPTSPDVRREVFPLLQDNMIRDIDSYCGFIDSLAQKISCKVSEMPLMLTTPDNDQSYAIDRKKVAAHLFEKNDSPALYFVSKALSALFCSGRLNGVIVDAGAHQTNCAAIYDGYLLRKSLRTVQFGGEEITRGLRTELERSFHGREIPGTGIAVGEDGVSRITLPNGTLSASYEQFTLNNEYRALKESIFAFSPKDENQEEYALEMPDGQMMKVHSLANSTQALFDANPPSLGEDLQSKVIDLIQDCHTDCRKILLNNLVLSGGNSLLPNFQKNVEQKLFESSPAYMKIKVTASPKALERKFASWLGASILASVGDFQKLWVSKFDYQEVGENIVLRKCVN